MTYRDYMLPFNSPLRYPGGKRKIASYFKQIIRENLLLDCIYVEPYAGGASVAITLLLDGYVSKIVINDADRSIYAFWHSVLYETSALCELIQNTPINIKVWKKERRKQLSKEKCTLLELGFSTFFLNRTNRSGILMGGVIGGVNQNGKWKIDARYNKENLIKRIKKIAEHSSRIQLYNLDAAELIETVCNNLPEKTLIYFDPPYYVKGKNLYLNHYNPDDHSNLSKRIQSINSPHWILTYDDVLPIRKLYVGYKCKKFKLRYSAHKSSFGQELMFFSNNLYVTANPILAREI